MHCPNNAAARSCPFCKKWTLKRACYLHEFTTRTVFQSNLAQILTSRSKMSNLPTYMVFVNVQKFTLLNLRIKNTFIWLHRFCSVNLACKKRLEVKWMNVCKISFHFRSESTSAWSNFKTGDNSYQTESWTGLKQTWFLYW